MTTRTGRMLFTLALIALAGLPALSQTTATTAAVPAGSLIMSKTVPFKLDEPQKLDIAVGALRVPELRITREDGSLIDSVLPPRGGQTRFSYLRYALSAENPSKESWDLAVRVRLIDKNGAVIDEFEFKKGVSEGRARLVDLKRLTLNYAVPLIDRVELTLSAER